ncbi:hypothetical protein AA0472_3015 [Acetobacter estunensis NRIC 0472]|uniref:DUF563 domain-containing protein n=1 Tax=Acetobacter estunensis TaxID=104097 RepID=A0A967B9M1_9PROT|nr:glycosyltransferase family 61 protein [Acetobacter estunensis]NHO52968.1 DUF563 domain-containing protein [Acetobacter estunensis]GBQ29575.1 hypothetical protein AA0472_3015 [Acetobacter estunensis NRIC 0472]
MKNVFVCIPFAVGENHFQYLFDVFSGFFNIKNIFVEIVVVAKGVDEKFNCEFNRCFGKFCNERMKVTLNSVSEENFSWCHIELMKEKFSYSEILYTHFVYIESDIFFSSVNFEYFLEYRAYLSNFGLIPGFLRIEFNRRQNDVFVCDQAGQFDQAGKFFVHVNGMDFVEVGSCAVGLFVLDREGFSEYINTRSSDEIESNNVVQWGVAQRAGMGLMWENIPPGFQARMVVPLCADKSGPDPMCWVRHVSDSFTNDYNDTPNFILGKTRLDQMFKEKFYGGKNIILSSARSFNTKKHNGIKFLTEVFECCCYDRSKLIAFGDKSFLDNLSFYNFPLENSPAVMQNVILVKFDDIYVVGGIIYPFLDKEITVLYEIFRPNDRPALPVPDVNFSRGIEYNYQNDNVNFICTSAGSASNYGHWLVDDLPRFKALDGFKGKKINIILQSGSELLNYVRQESICMAFPEYEFEFIFYDGRYPIRLKDAYYVTPTTYHPIVKSSPALKYLSCLGQKMRRSNSSKRIFLLRRPPERRALVNYNEVMASLSKYNFDLIDISGWSVKRQAEIFSGAEIVAGCMGAAMTNVVFSALGLETILFAPEGWVEPFYWDLAMARGDSYVVFYGKTLNTDVAPNDSDYEIDISSLELYLERRFGYR